MAEGPAGSENGDPPRTPTSQESSHAPRTPDTARRHGENGCQVDGLVEEGQNGALQTLDAADVTEEEEDEEDGTEEEDEEEEGDQDDEPKLKYQRLTATLSTLYRNGDASSCFFVGGDKIIFGTHNGNIVVLAIPGFQAVRVYHAHSASISAISVSPFPVAFPTSKFDHYKIATTADQSPNPSLRETQTPKRATSPRAHKQPPVPVTPSNSIYIATSSIDGHVCVSSLVDPKDVTLRNFGRPVSAVAISPNYKQDRTYLSGGLAGNLILTVGGKAGVSANANTNSTAVAASGWLSSIGLGSGAGTDKIVHAGEGAITAIKWSLSGKFVVWVNEHGVKIMRTSNKLESSESDLAWTRIGHIDKPNRSNWDELAAGWKPRLDWVDESTLESDESDSDPGNGTRGSTPAQNHALSGLRTARDMQSPSKRRNTEKLVIGWGDTVWVVHVKPESNIAARDSSSRTGGSAVWVHHLLFDDCIVSGVSLYTPSLLLVLAYRTRDDEDKPLPVLKQGTPRRGVQHRQTGLSPELRLININTKEEVDADTLTMSRYESLGAGDYHLGKLYIPPEPVAAPVSRGALEAIGGGIWDASVNATRLFSSSASVQSGTGSNDNSQTTSGSRQLSMLGSPSIRPQEQSRMKASPGVKIFVQSPYDLVLALKRDLSDHLGWLLDRKQFQAAWELVTEHPEVVSYSIDDISEDGNSTPTVTKRQNSLADFFADDTASQTEVSGTKAQRNAVNHELRRIGESWIDQLVQSDKWEAAGIVAGRVLGASPRWEHWVWKFAQAGRFDEITPYIPSKPLHPRLPSVVYERILGHYLISDRVRFQSLIDNWEPELFNIAHITEVIQHRLATDDIREDSTEDGVQGRDWMILLSTLARLKIASGQPQDAVECYFKLHNADAAMNLIAEYHLVTAIANDVPGFVTLRVSKTQLQAGLGKEMEENASEAVRMLVDESANGTIQPSVVVEQLELKGHKYRPFIYLYLCALWKGDGTDTRSHRIRQRLELQGRMAVEEFGDLAVSLFAEYDRKILMEFLRASRSYSYEQATTECENRKFYPELVYLLAQTGQTKRALNLIINSLEDVQFAIDFAKEQEDAELWDDLLEFSMDKPSFIRGLLEGVGTAIDPIKLVRRIPEGLEIEGLRDGIGRMVREYEIQSSISEGVARVLRGEVAAGMDQLRSGRATAVKFELALDEKVPESDDTSKMEEEIQAKIETKSQEPKPGHCVKCSKAFHEGEKDLLIGFACGHVYHLACIIVSLEDPQAISVAERLQAQMKRGDDDTSEIRGVGAKIAHAHMIKSIIGRGCPRCHYLTVE